MNPLDARRCMVHGAVSAVLSIPLFSNPLMIGNGKVSVSIKGSEAALWEYQVAETGRTFPFAAPVFHVNGKDVAAVPSQIRLVSGPVTLSNRATEYTFGGAVRAVPGLVLRIVFRIPEANPVVRFRYELVGAGGALLTKKDGRDRLLYLSVPIQMFDRLKEVRFSEFNEMVHSFCLSERDLDDRHFSPGEAFMGPLLSGTGGGHAFLIAYEHGSQVPDAFLEYTVSPDRILSLRAVKGNYWNGRPLSVKLPFSTVWMQAAAVPGDEELLAAVYRSFVLHDQSENMETRKPYIFYNTWNYQERVRNWQHRPYLSDMRLDRMLEEIDAAHRMGIDVFVIDTGWYEKTGDWAVSQKRFPDGLKQVKARLDAYGMKLGLWFNPNAAAATSRMYRENADCAKTKGGKIDGPFPVWETEESYSMCLASRYRDAFAEKLVELNRSLGVTYYKWDAVGQYGCDSPDHGHGTRANPAQEREDCFAFEVGRSMCYVVDRVCAAVPEAIVDFDITEGYRAVGLAFLSSGKYFLINNGPYYFNYNIPFDSEKDNWNIFFHPGAARGWICRTPLSFDKWFPTVCFLTHYLPDDPWENQTMSVASLILGQHGIWGDLPKVSPEGTAFIGKALGLYKQIRSDATEAALIRDGAVGGSPEVYEKVNPATGRGLVVLFSSHAGKYRYVTRNAVDPSVWYTPRTGVSFDGQGRAVIEAEFLDAEAKTVLFGVKE